MFWECVTCDVPQTGKPAAQTPGGPQCLACVREDRGLAASLKRSRKKRKKRRAR